MVDQSTEILVTITGKYYFFGNCQHTALAPYSFPYSSLIKLCVEKNGLNFSDSSGFAENYHLFTILSVSKAEWNHSVYCYRDGPMDFSWRCMRSWTVEQSI